MARRHIPRFVYYFPCSYEALFFALKVQHNLAQGKRMVCATPWVNTEFPLHAPCKGSKITSVALRRQGFVGARHASPAITDK